MEALKTIEQYWQQLKQFGVHAQFCAEGDVRVAVCRDFWIWIAAAVVGAGLLIIALIAKRLIRQQLEFYRARKRLEARKIVASEEVMAEVRWKGDALKGNLEELPAAVLADKFRTALEKDKAPGKSP